MEAKYCSTLINTVNQGELSIQVPDKAFEVYRKICGLKPLYPRETLAYWTCLSTKGLTCLFPYLSCCPSSVLKGLVLECAELITFCTSMDHVIQNRLVDFDSLLLPFRLNKMQKCLELLSAGDTQFKNFNLKIESLQAWRYIQEMVQSPSFPFGIDIDKSMDTHDGFSKCNSPKSILDANSHFSDSTSSSSSEGLDDNESSSLSEEDMSHFRELLSFALESPPSQKKYDSKPFESVDPLHNQNPNGLLFPSNSMKYQQSDNIYNFLNPFSDRAIAVPPYPSMSSVNENTLKRAPPATIPAFQASHKFSDQSPQYPCPHKCSDLFPQYPCPCRLFASMEKHLGYDKIGSFPIAPNPKINTNAPPLFPNLPQPPAPPLHPYNRNPYNRNNTAGQPFYNVGRLPILDPVHFRPPLPVNRGSAPLRSNIPFNGGMQSSQQLHYSFRNSKENSGDSIGLFENELQELLRGRRKPIRISALPAMYEEKFRKPFNKSHEKLTALLSKCSNIVLVYRQGGQHVIMLKHHESVPAVRLSRRSNKSLDPRSRKVYLTFPPGSTFTSDDAEVYFRQFGTVRGVRMSHEEPPTYAFVEFYTCEGALSALCSTRAHYINCQKVMVKPYRQSFSYKL